MRRKIYIETTIPSFYYEARTEPDMVARREWTRQWWTIGRKEFELVTSVAVIDELGQGDFPAQGDCLALLEGLPVLAVEPAILEIVESYISHHVMPNDPVGDALHLANANKFDHIRRVNTLLGLYVPALVTPLEFLGEEYEK
jgi:hypothetical protein